MSEATLLEKLVKMGLPLDAAYTEGQFQYVIDAALRRAKAEGWREAIVGATNLKASVANGIPPHERVGFVRACNELIGYAKARAAQIEEGE